jgi:hypothetical protein
MASDLQYNSVGLVRQLAIWLTLLSECDVRRRRSDAVEREACGLRRASNGLMWFGLGTIIGEKRGEAMAIAKGNRALVAAAVLALAGAALAGGADNTNEAKITRAMAAGPDNVARGAKIVDKDAQGRTVVLREGTNGFTCTPGNPNVIGDPAKCMDAASVQWFADAAAHKPKPTNTVPGITYMLAGATQRSDTDPTDTTSAGFEVGPHWMVMWAFDPKTTGLPTVHKATGAYIMFAGTPWAHMHVMGRP